MQAVFESTFKILSIVYLYRQLNFTTIHKCIAGAEIESTAGMVS